MKETKKSMYLLVMISMCGLIASTVGLIINSSGVFFNPIAEDFGIMKGSVSMTLTICNLVMAVSGILAPKVLEKFPLRSVLLVSTIIQAGSTALLAMMNSIFPMYILNGLRGFSAGITSFVLVTMVLNQWFKEKNALVTSIALGFSGIAGALFSPVISSVIQSAGWRTGYLVVAVIMIILNLPSILFLPSIDPHQKGYTAFGEETVVEEKRIVVDETIDAPAINGFLVFLACAYCLLISAPSALSQHFPGMAEAMSLSTTVGTTMISICMMVNTFGKILLGILIERFGVQKSMFIYVACLLAGLVMLLVQTDITMLIASGLVGAVYGLGAVGTVMLVKTLFSDELYPRVYPTVSMFGTLSNAVFSTVIGYLYDFTGGYSATLLLFIVMVIMCAGVMLLSFRFKKQTA